MQISTVLFIFTVLISSTLARPSTGVYPRSDIGVFPIVECPEDSLVPTVILLPSVGDFDLAANQYVVCFKGVPQVFNCSEGLFFNWSTMSCDFPYERSSRSGANTNGTSPVGDLDLIPAGPIQVPTSPQFPIPIWWRRRGNNGFAPPPYPITKPDPSVIMPLPVLPAHPHPAGPRPVPYYYY